MLKKFLIGTFVALAFMLVASQASADCSITTTLKVGSSGAEVSCLQTKVGATADGAFGPMTKASVMAYQASHGLSADGVVGPLSRAVLNGAVSGNFPVGCLSASGFSSITGLACVAVPSSTAGCTSGAAFSSTTGLSCTSVIAGCSAGAAFSSTTGASCTGGSTPAGPLAGTAGILDDVNRLSQYSGEEVGDGQKDIKVMGFEVVASNDGDIALNSMKVRFVITNGGGSTRLEDYVNSISILQGSTKVGTANATDFNRESSGVYTKVVSLSNSVVRADKTEKFYITVDAQSNLDSGDIDSETVVISTDNIRYTDGGGVTTTDTNTGDLDATGATVAFVTFSASSDTELKIALNNTPSAGAVKVDSTDNTDNVVLLKGKLTVSGTSSVWMDTLPIQLTAVTSLGSVAAITGSLTLTLGSNTYTEAINTTNCIDESDFAGVEDCTLEANEITGILFDGLDYTIPAGTTVNFTVSADINDLDATTGEAVNFDAGDSLKAEFTTTARGLTSGLTVFVVENDEGDALAVGEKTGSALGEAQTFYADGVSTTMGTVTYESVADGSDTTQVTYNIPLTVTAFGDTRYIGLSAENHATYTSIATNKALTYALQLSSAPASDIAAEAGNTNTWTCNTAIEATTAYRLDEGTPVSCTLQVVVTTATGVPGSFRVHVNGIQTNSVAALTDATELKQALTPVENFETGYKFLTN